jgi:hypothetical protein
VSQQRTRRSAGLSDADRKRLNDSSHHVQTLRRIAEQMHNSETVVIPATALGLGRQVFGYLVWVGLGVINVDEAWFRPCASGGGRRETRARATAVAGTIRTDGATVAATRLLDAISRERPPASA